jgi:hypothetical protein
LFERVNRSVHAAAKFTRSVFFVQYQFNFIFHPAKIVLWNKPRSSLASARLNDPGDFLHLLESLMLKLAVAGAITHSESHTMLRICCLAYDDLFALAESALDVSSEARLALGFAVQRSAILDVHAHLIRPFLEAPN